jgi:hypothetical protein
MKLPQKLLLWSNRHRHIQLVYKVNQMSTLKNITKHIEIYDCQIADSNQPLNTNNDIGL